jgi:hypothetical protein
MSWRATNFKREGREDELLVGDKMQARTQENIKVQFVSGIEARGGGRPEMYPMIDKKYPIQKPLQRSANRTT